MKDRAWLIALRGLLRGTRGSIRRGSAATTCPSLRDALIFGLLAASLDLFWGRTGILCFGHAAFFGVGGYAMALVSLNADLPIGQPARPARRRRRRRLLAAVVGYFLFFGGVRGSYFTIVTLALSVIAQQAAISWSSVTGGDSGLLGIPPLAFALGPLLARPVG